jgi:hypothetical protein
MEGIELDSIVLDMFYCMWLGVAPKWIPQRLFVQKRLEYMLNMCHPFYHSIVNIIGVTHMTTYTSTRIFISIINTTIIRALKLMRKVAMASICYKTC